MLVQTGGVGILCRLVSEEGQTLDRTEPLPNPQARAHQRIQGTNRLTSQDERAQDLEFDRDTLQNVPPWPEAARDHLAGSKRTVRKPVQLQEVLHLELTNRRL